MLSALFITHPRTLDNSNDVRLSYILYQSTTMFIKTHVYKIVILTTMALVFSTTRG